MNAILPRSLAAVQAEVIAGWRAQPGALMLLGRASAPIPKSGSARTASTLAAVGVFRSESWRHETSGETRFLTVIRLPDRSDPAHDAELVLRGARATDAELRLRLRSDSREAEFGREIAREVGGQAARIAHFMLDVMRSEDGSDMRRPHAVLRSYLEGAARKDGCIELVLRAPDHCLVLQGWGGRRPADPTLITFTPELRQHQAEAAEFERHDVPAPASGSVLVLPDQAAPALDGVTKLFLLTQDDLLFRDVLDARVLGPEASFGQLSHLLPRLNCADATLAKLLAACRPRFNGVDTLNTSQRPVRAAVDIAVHGGGTGVYLSGWIFDPANEIREVAFGAGDALCRIDRSMTRIRREDVSTAFREDSRFPVPRSHEFGFAAHVAGPAIPGAAPHLHFTFSDDATAFLPLSLADATDRATRGAIMQSVDLHKPSGTAIVERHLAPFLSRAASPADATCEVAWRGPTGRRRAIVVPLATGRLPRPLIASLLEDPAGPEEQLVFCCEPGWLPSDVDALTNLLALYEVPATVLVAAASAGPLGAVLCAAAETTASSFLLASWNASCAVPGWRDALDRADPNAAALCPTVLYEDRSIRFAGSRTVTALPRAPFVRVHAALSGLSADYAAEAGPGRVESGSLACCLFRRDALGAINRSLRFATAAAQEASVFADLSRSGRTCLWIPEIQVAAPDSDETRTTVSLLADGWMLRDAAEGMACGF